ncbi:MAG TPA: serine/threonine protein kinase, partial [Armatimonadetes bacterium]|nr:serine/threonine protein kinase [Armatimonadota bacterium]
TVARFNQPTDIYYHAAHQAFYVTDTGNNRIRRIAANGAVTTVAGTGAAGAADDWGNAATLDRPQFIDALPNGSLVVTTAD